MHFRRRSRPPENCELRYPGDRGAGTSCSALGGGRTVRTRLPWKVAGAGRSPGTGLSLRFLKADSLARMQDPSLAIVPVIFRALARFHLPPPWAFRNPTLCPSPFPTHLPGAAFPSPTRAPSPPARSKDEVRAVGLGSRTEMTAE